MGMFDGLFGGSDTRTQQIDKAVDQASADHQVVDHKDNFAQQHPKMVGQDAAPKKGKSAEDKAASKSIQDWIESGR